MNTPVAFNLAKLIKEKKFDRISQELWYFNGSNCIKLLNRNSENFGFSAPTIAEVVMWLYEKHNMWVLVLPTITGHFTYKVVDVRLDPQNPIERPPYKGVSANDFNSPTEAYEAAIQCLLENIK
jgi:hypothetical protein